MLYLEDYIELIEHLPDELRDRLTEMREMDLNVQNTMDSINVRAENFFARSRRLRGDDRDKEYGKICGEYRKVYEESQEKATLADKMHGLFSKHLRKLDQELVKFKMELEADNSGITEVLEKRSLEMDESCGAAGGSHKPLYLRNLGYGSRKHDTRKNGTNKKPLSRLGGTAQSFQAFRSGQGPTVLKNRLPGSINDARANAGQAGKNGTLFKQQLYHHDAAEKSSSNPIAAAASQAIVATQQLQLGRRSSSLKASFEAAKNSDLKSLTKDFAATKKRTGNNNLPGNQSPSLLSKSGDASNASFDDVSFSPTITNLIQSAKLNSNTTRDEAFTPSSVMNHAPLSLIDFASTDRPFYPHGVLYGEEASLLNSAERIYPGSIHLPPKRAPWNGSIGPNSGRRRARTDRDDLDQDDEDDAGVADEDDPNEPRYCVCHQVSYGEMVACDNPGCPYEWFHYPCVGINQPPKGKWYCPGCVAVMANTCGQR